MPPLTRPDPILSVLLVILTGVVGLAEWGVAVAPWGTPVVLGAVVVLLTAQVRWSRRVFVLVAAILTVVLICQSSDWRAVLDRAVRASAFIAAFFTALSTLRNVAETSDDIAACGRFLAKRPPGQRYAALSVGGHLFALILNYGSISLLGSLATTAAQTETDPVLRTHRTRRMLLAIQRGFISCLPWSPLGFCMAMTNVLIPGASWITSVGPGLITAGIMIVSGWALDSLFKPRLSPPPRPVASEGTWWLLSPLLILLLVLGGVVFALHDLLDIRIVGVVIFVVPVVSLAWAVLQQRRGQGPRLATRGLIFLTRDLPNSRNEIILLIMAGYIGTIGAPVLLPLITASGLHPDQWPAWVVLTGALWLIPILGQLGMNPILAVSLLAPSLPAADTLGTTPTAIVTAIAAGWAIAGITSPFTATTMLTGSFGGVSAWHVGLKWNGGYLVVAGGLLTVWVLVYGLVLS